MGHKIDATDARLGEIAARQHVVSLRQLEALGLSRYAVAKRAEKGRLHRLHQGVYAVGHRGLSWHGRWMAAVLACADGAVLSHGSAAALWGLLRPVDGPTHISIPSTSGRIKRRGIHIHRCPSLARPLTTRRDRIPVTTVPRTIEDLRASSLPEYLVRRAIRQAELKGMKLDGIESDRSRSDLEAAFLALFAAHRIPQPEVNPKIGRYEVDFLWREQKLIVEADTFTYHRGSISFEDDHARDLDLRQRGYAVLRFTDRQLENDPEGIAANIRDELAAPRR